MSNQPNNKRTNHNQYQQASFDLFSSVSDQGFTGDTNSVVSSSGYAFSAGADQPDPDRSKPLTKGFVPSHYQRAIFDFVLDEAKGDAVVAAVPGAGKSRTLLEVASLLPRNKSVLMVAFNKHIAKELDDKLRLAGLHRRSHPLTGQRLVTAQTIHSLGHTTLSKYLLPLNRDHKRATTTYGNGSFWDDGDNDSRDDLSSGGNKLNLVEGKYDELVKEFIVKNNLNRHDYAHSVIEMIRLTQLTLTDPQDEEAMLELVKHYNLVEAFPIWETALKMTRLILQQGARLAEEKGTINFDDMLYLPNLWNLQPPQFDFVLVDEAQDLSRAQLELVLRCRASTTTSQNISTATPTPTPLSVAARAVAQAGEGRFLFVGDRHQGIFGFTAADNQAIERIIERTSATELPLSISYRCPRSHVDLAAQVYPGIEAAPAARPGELRYDVSEDDLLAQVESGDLVLCRTTAPLISNCFHLLRNGVKAKVRGRDIGRSLKAIVTLLEKQVAREGGNPITFNLSSFDLASWLEVYQESQIAKAVSLRAAPTNVETIADKAQTLAAIYFNAQPRPKTLSELKEKIGQLFSDTDTNVVWFSSIHRAKGLEAERVWLLRPDLLPHPMAKIAWEKEQERNCQYVAYTRAKTALYIVQSAVSTTTNTKKTTP